jgi:hypothetical protein
MSGPGTWSRFADSRRRAGDGGCEPVSHPPLDRVGLGANELGDFSHSGATPLVPTDQRIVEDRLGGAPGICLAELRDQRAGFGGSGSDSSTGSASIRPHKTAPKTSIRHAASSSRVAVRRPRPRARSRRRRRVAFLTWGRSSRCRRRAHSRSASIRSRSSSSSAPWPTAVKLIQGGQRPWSTGHAKDRARRSPS